MREHIFHKISQIFIQQDVYYMVNKKKLIFVYLPDS